MKNLIWAEWKKLRRSSIVLFTVIATILIAAFVLFAGQSVTIEGYYLNDPGWYMTMVQPWATILILPAMISMLGSYMICREEQDDTLKSLLLIPLNETALTAAKMIVTFVLSVLIHLLLFVITLSTELILHYSNLSIGMVHEASIADQAHSFHRCHDRVTEPAPETEMSLFLPFHVPADPEAAGCTLTKMPARERRRIIGQTDTICLC